MIQDTNHGPVQPASFAAFDAKYDKLLLKELKSISTLSIMYCET